EPCYNQNFNENYYPHNSSSFLCGDNCEGPHESFQCESINQNFFKPNPCYEPNSSSFDQYQPLQSFVAQQLPQRSNEDTKLKMAKLIKNNRILLNNNIFPHEEASMEVLLAKERILKLIQAWDEKKIESWSLPTFLLHLLNDSRTIDEMMKQREQPTKRGTRIAKSLQNFRVKKSSTSLNNTSQISPVHAIAPVLPTEEQSSVKNLVPIPSLYEVTFDDESECDVPIKDESSPAFTTFLNPLFDCNDDFTSSDDELLSDEDVPMEDFKVYSNPFFDDEEINSDKVDPHNFNIESDFVESLSNRNTLFDSSPRFDYLEEFSGELMPTSINSCPRPLENFHTDTIVETLPTSPILVEDSDSQREEIDMFTGMDDLLPPSIESGDYDSEGDIHFLEELLVNDSISLPKNKSSNFDHHNNPSFPRPPHEPPNVEVLFDFEPNSGEVISAVMNNINELNEDECFDPGGEINVFPNVKDDDYFPFIFVIRIFLPYLI
nr:hypothetical protein [Tanacetum cinerariifolium]